MNFEEHYGDLTPFITLNGITPFANSMPINKCFLSTKLNKKLKKQDVSIDTYMNVIYEREQSFDTEMLEWKMQDLELDVVLIDSTRVFVKGRHFWAYCVGIKA